MDPYSEASTIPFTSEKCVLNTRESEAFVEALLNPAEPNEALREAATRYQRLMLRPYPEQVLRSA